MDEYQEVFGVAPEETEPAAGENEREGAGPAPETGENVQGVAAPGTEQVRENTEEEPPEGAPGGEEQEALEQALGYVKRPTMDERIAQKEKAAAGKKKERS